MKLLSCTGTRPRAVAIAAQLTTEVRTLASMSYRLAKRIPSTLVLRHAASPATSALVKRCFVILHSYIRITGRASLCTGARGLTKPHPSCSQFEAVEHHLPFRREAGLLCMPRATSGSQPILHAKSHIRQPAYLASCSKVSCSIDACVYQYRCTPTIAPINWCMQLSDATSSGYLSHVLSSHRGRQLDIEC